MSGKIYGNLTRYDASWKIKHSYKITYAGFIGREQLEQFQKPINGTNRTASLIAQRNK